MSVERLEQKSKSIYQLLDTYVQDWERVFLIVLGRSFGMKVNSSVFENFCSKIDLLWLHRNNSDALKVESVMFGLAGFLEHEVDEYSEVLKREFDYLKGIQNWDSVRMEEWRFMRMRPYNFPTYRIGQFSALMVAKTYWFAYLQEVECLEDLFEMLDNAQMNKYWASHYRFGVETVLHSVNWSHSFKIHLVINCFIPMLFAYGQFMNIEKFNNRAIDWLNALPAEINKITKAFKGSEVGCYSASDSQALLHLKANYCDKKRCLDCAIGLAILK